MTTETNPTKKHESYIRFRDNRALAGACHDCGQPSHGFFRCVACRNRIGAQKAARQNKEPKPMSGLILDAERKRLSAEEIDAADRIYVLDQYTRDALANHECSLKELKRRYFNKAAYNQLIEAVSIVQSVMNKHVTENPGTFLDPKLFDLTWKIGDLLGDLYQAVGEKI